MMEQFYYTEREMGKGFEPGKKGFQVAACSPGIDTAVRAVLADLATHYGRTVLWESGPKEAKELERQLRLSDEENESAPPALIQAYPAIWDCYRLTDGRMALSRSGYRGFVRDGRPGNFFVHTLVVDPHDLAAFAHNPMVLARSGLFKEYDESEATQLPTLAPQPPAPFAATDLTPLSIPIWSTRIAAMLAALLGTQTGGPPLLLCLPGWLEGQGLLEALLALVPPGYRGRISFCTNETQLRWQPASDTAKGEGGKAGHDLLVFCGPDHGVKKLQQSDYSADFAIFNFTEQKFSDSVTPGDYACFAADCALTRKEGRLWQYHDLVGRLGCDNNPGAWDVLVKAMPFMDELAAASSLCEALEAVLGLPVFAAGAAGLEAKAAIVRDLLQPRLRRVAGGDDTRGLLCLVGPLGRLVALLGREDAQAFAGEIGELAATAFGEGKFVLAEGLLTATGPMRVGLTRRLLATAVGDARLMKLAISDPREAETLTAMVAEALSFGQEKPWSPAETEWLLHLVFSAGRTAGTSSKAWARLGSQAVEPFLQAQPEEAGLAFLRRLLGLFPPEVCPEAYAFLAARLLVIVKPGGEELTAQLTALLQEAKRSSQAELVAEALLVSADGLLAGLEERALLCGRMAVGFARSSLAEYWYRNYRAAIAAVPSPLPIRTTLATSGGASLSAREFLDALAGDMAMSSLEEAFLPLLQLPEILALVCASLSRSLGDSQIPVETLDCCETAIKVCAGVADPEGRVAALYDKLIIAIPLAALAEKTFPDEPIDRRSDLASLRLRAAAFLYTLRQEASRPGWSLGDLPVNSPFWRDDLPVLPSADHLELLSLVRAFAVSSCLENHAQLIGLITLLQELGEAHPVQVAEHLAGFAERQKPQGLQQITGLVIAAAMADTAPVPFWLPMAEILIDQLDPMDLQTLQAELSPAPPALPPREETAAQPAQPLPEEDPQAQTIEPTMDLAQPPAPVQLEEDPHKYQKRQRLLTAISVGLAAKQRSSLAKTLGFGREKAEQGPNSTAPRGGDKDQDPGGMKKLFSGFKKLWKGK